MRLTLLGLLAVSCSTVETGPREVISPVTDVSFLHYGLGAGPSVFTDAGGQLVEERRDEPFGAPIGVPDLVARDLNALNKRTDATTGWSDHGARWMAPATARWLTPDPPVAAPDPAFMAAPWTLHPYQYVDQNPVAFWDPDGNNPSPTERALLIYSELTRHGPATMLDMARIAGTGWKVVMNNPEFSQDRGTYDTTVGSGSVATVVSSVLRLAEAAPIQRLMISDHGFPGVQTLGDEYLVDAKPAPGSPVIHPELLRLAGKFSNDGVLVLSGCNLMADDRSGSTAVTTDALRSLSTALGVEVRAGDQRNSSERDDIWTGNVTACRDGNCVTGWGESGLPEAWGKAQGND